MFFLREMEEENVGGDHEIGLESSSSSGRDDEKVEAFGLLEDSWFFGNSLKQKPRMSRCFSDPCPSSSSSAASPKEGKGLVRAPSLPPYLGRDDKVAAEKKKSPGKGKGRELTRQLSDGKLLQAPKPASVEIKKAVQGTTNDMKPEIKSNGIGKSSLLRTPSLPVSLTRKELAEENESETDMSMSKLIWQAWADSPEIKTPKAVTQTQSPKNIPRSRPPRNVEADSVSAPAVKETRRPSPRPKTLKKSLSSIDYKDLQGFKHLGFKDVIKQDKVRKPDLSKAWIKQTYVAPQTSNCVAKNSTEDMKAQIKFWARAVATNVRQEC